MDVQTVVPLEDVRRFVVDCLNSCGTDEENSKVVADVLSSADYRGFYTHGLFRLELYCRVLRNGVTFGSGFKPTVVKQTPATALVDANKLLGAVVGKFAMDLAIEKAKNVGIGIVSVKASNHIGMAGWYSMRACDQGLLGITMTNTSPVVVPTRSKTPTLGTNPISVAAPGKNGDSFVLDMATSAAAYGKIDLKKLHGQPCPHGWIVDNDGKETLDPTNFKGLLPVGGVEESGGYKGYGLSMMVDIMCAVLSGNLPSPFLCFWKTALEPANFSQCFIAIDPNVFEDGFEERLSQLLDHCRSLEPVVEGTKVLVAGDAEKANMAKCDELGGIPYNKKQMDILNGLAAELKVQPLKPVLKQN